jgi:hypothetical protein
LYTVRQIVCLALLMFACRIPSRRRLDLETDDAMFLRNWCVLSRDQSDTVVCSKQMANVLKTLSQDEIAGLGPDFLRDLIRDKQAKNLYLLGHVMMGADGTGIFASSQFHCPQCLTQEHKDGSKTYLHNVLEIKALGHDGMAISVLTEPQLNPKDGKYDKQDCETKAFHRALPKLKQLFPHLCIAHLLDSLYAQAPILRAIEEVNHKFICCFKRGSIPTLYDEVLELRKLVPENRITRTVTREGHRILQVYTWVNGLQYQDLTMDFVMCEETVDGKTTTFAFLTNFDVTDGNAEAIAKGGRARWNIEEGFNEQKTGYELEHFCRCKDLDLMLNLYYLLQIAHLFMQLLARSDLIQDITHLSFLAKLLLEAWRNLPLPDELLDPRPPKGQIRFNKGPT